MGKIVVLQVGGLGLLNTPVSLALLDLARKALLRKLLIAIQEFYKGYYFLASCFYVFQVAMTPLIVANVLLIA